MSPEPIRLGIIGTGLAVEKLHWPALKQLPDRFTVTAFSNRGRENAERFAAYSDAGMDRFVPDYQDLLRRDDVDAVLLSVPIPMNQALIVESLEAGKHVIAEKPPGMTMDEAWSLLEIEAAHPGQRLLLAENHFYRDDVRLARSIVDSGALGRVHLVSWRNISQLVPKEGWFPGIAWRQEAVYGGGPHLDAGVHHMAWIRMLCGDATRVSGEIQDANSTHAGPSDLVMTIRFASGVAGSYTGSYPELPMPDEPNDLRLYGTEGVLSFRAGHIQLFRPDGTERWTVTPVDQPWYTGGYNAFHRGYYNEFRNFHEAIEHGAPVVGTLLQSIRTMELVLAGIESARQGKVMAMDDSRAPLLVEAVPLWAPYGAGNLDTEAVHTTSRSS